MSKLSKLYTFCTCMKITQVTVCWLYLNKAINQKKKRSRSLNRWAASSFIAMVLWHLLEGIILKPYTKIVFCSRMPKSLRQNWGVCLDYSETWLYRSPFWDHVDRASNLSGNVPSSQWEDIQVSGGNWGNDNLMSSTLSNFFKSMIQRIGLPWTFQTSEASQGHEYSDIPGEKIMVDKVEMRNDLFRSLDPIANS